MAAPEHMAAEVESTMTQSSVMTKALQYVMGVALAVAALGLWFVPGSLAGDPVQGLIKLGVTLVMGLMGLSLLALGRSHR
jgi:hypothetical protein